MLEELKRPNDMDLAYFAGFFDGEGCVFLHRKLRGEKNPSYKLKIQIGSTYLPVLDRVKTIWGFGNITAKSYETRPNRKPSWFWVVHGDKALLVLECILPYLSIKRSDAQLGISFQKWKIQEAGIWGSRVRRPEDIVAKEQQVKDLMTVSRGLEPPLIQERFNAITGVSSSVPDEVNGSGDVSLSIAKLMYFAGLFDAEGCVVFGGKRRTNGKPNYTLMVEISGTHFPTAERVRNTWGFGSIGTEGINTVSRPNRRPCWRWIISGSRALRVLESVYPYLVVKKADAEVGISFQRWKSGEPKGHNRSHRTEGSYAKEGMFKELLPLVRGSSDLPTVRSLVEDIVKGQN